MGVVEFKRIEGYVPASKKQALATVIYQEAVLETICHGMFMYASKDEFMKWVDEVYERCNNDYQDWLSVQ